MRVYYSIKSTRDQGQIGSTRQAATPCRSADDLYQALVSSNEQALTACEEYKPLGVFLNFSMSALPKTTQRNSGN